MVYVSVMENIQPDLRNVRAEGDLVHLGSLLTALGIGTNPTVYVGRHLDRDQWRLHQFPDASGKRRARHYAVTESGLYTVLLSAPRSEPGKAFRRWVTDRAAPAVRSASGYDDDAEGRLALVRSLAEPADQAAS